MLYSGPGRNNLLATNQPGVYMKADLPTTSNSATEIAMPNCACNDLPDVSKDHL